MSTSNAQKNSPTTDRELVFTRLFDAPRALVWAAWTDPAQIAQWWGPNGFTTTILHYDLRVGGTWKHIMHGPDGVDYPNEHTFTEVVPNERLVHVHGGSKPGGTPVLFEMIVTFEDEGAQTRLTMRQVFPTAEARDQIVREYHAEEGAKQHLGRLAQYLASQTGATA
jgi:uncharacterized protein YndB with AHSA1/START domain